MRDFNGGNLHAPRSYIRAELEYQIALDNTAPKTMPKIVLTHGLEVSGQVPEEQPMKR
jgi:hypothetical protein